MRLCKYPAALKLSPSSLASSDESSLSQSLLGLLTNAGFLTPSFSPHLLVWLPTVRKNFPFFPTYLFPFITVDAWTPFIGLRSFAVIIYFDPQIFLDLASGSPFKLVHVPFGYVSLYF